MKIILMGTPDFVVPIFDKIANAHEVIAVFTRAPKPVGRKQVITKTPVHRWAESRGIPVYTSIREFDELSIDNCQLSIIVAAYGVILKDNVLKYNPINIHPSLLPKYRGAAPIVSAIMNGDTESGVCLMNMTAEVDAGDILMRDKFQIGANETTADVEKKVAAISGDMVLRYLENQSAYPAVPQTGDPTFTKKITAGDTVIDWKKTPAEIHNQIRAIGGRTTVNGIGVKILTTRIGDGKLIIENVQPSGKKPMSWQSFLNGLHETITIGE
jgi:methionyl-tRNA formyltransferase